MLHLHNEPVRPLGTNWRFHSCLYPKGLERCPTHSRRPSLLVNPRSFSRPGGFGIYSSAFLRSAVPPPRRLRYRPPGAGARRAEPGAGGRGGPPPSRPRRSLVREGAGGAGPARGRLESATRAGTVLPERAGTWGRGRAESKVTQAAGGGAGLGVARVRTARTQGPAPRAPPRPALPAVVGTGEASHRGRFRPVALRSPPSRRAPRSPPPRTRSHGDGGGRFHFRRARPIGARRTRRGTGGRPARRACACAAPAPPPRRLRSAPRGGPARDGTRFGRGTTEEPGPPAVLERPRGRTSAAGRPLCAPPSRPSVHLRPARAAAPLRGPGPSPSALSAGGPEVGGLARGRDPGESAGRAARAAAPHPPPSLSRPDPACPPRPSPALTARYFPCPPFGFQVSVHR